MDPRLTPHTETIQKLFDQVSELDIITQTLIFEECVMRSHNALFAEGVNTEEFLEERTLKIRTLFANYDVSFKETNGNEGR